MCRSILWIFLVSLVLSGTHRLMGQADTGGLRGQVTDPSGALVPAATVTLTGTGGANFSAQSTAGGLYVLKGVPAGTYSLKAVAKGFETLKEQGIPVTAGRTLEHNLALTIAVKEEQVAVTDQSSHVDVSSDANASQMVIKGSTLDALSDDPDELSNELSALAGPSAGPNGGQIFIDGFSGGQLPPKSSIREIRVNQNPFAAQYDRLGYGRIEILTKPGTDKLHGTFMMNGNDSSFNSLNPFVTSEPPYYSTFMMGNLGGSLTKKSSFFISVFRRDQQDNSIVNATTGEDADGNATKTQASYANPMTRLDISPRFDLQVTPNNTLTVRGSFNRSNEKNGGVGDEALISQAYNSDGSTNGFQLSDSQIINNNTVDETLFEYRRTTSNEHSLNTTPAIEVSGAFTGGGNSIGKLADTLDRYELQNNLSWLHGRHSFKFGTRLRATRDDNSSTSGFNGAYIYTTLANYLAGTASQYSITTGKPVSRVTAFDGSIYADDEFRIKPTFTLSYGVRYEAQNHTTDWKSVAPRLSFAWGVNKGRTVVRGGYGWFYDRFGSSYILNALRNNGVTQVETVVTNPGQSSSTSETTSTIYSVASKLRAPVTMEVAAGIEQQLAKGMMLSATYINSRGVHALLSDNINAPQVDGVASASGTRPDPTKGNIYQYQSNGVFWQNELVVNYSVSVRKISLFGFYMMNFANGDSQGASSFPSNPYKISADYGRSAFDVRSRFLLGGNIPIYYGVSFSPMMDFNSGTPFNLTTGLDNNGDSVYNDRPAFATDLTRSSVVKTALGNFDYSPTSGQKIVPINWGTGPSQFSINGRLSKRFAIGPKVQGGSGGGMGGPGGGPGGGGPPPGGGGPGGGLGPGGLSGNRGGPRFDQAQVMRKYSLNFGVMAHNILNSRNLAAPVGVVTSSNFDKSISLAGGFFGSASANRSVDLQVSFSF